MRFYYRFNDIPAPRDTYYSDEEIATFKVYQATKELDDEWNSDNDSSDLWVVPKPYAFSWEQADCKDINDARNKLGWCLNNSIYEWIHDL